MYVIGWFLRGMWREAFKKEISLKDWQLSWLHTGNSADHFKGEESSTEWYCLTVYGKFNITYISVLDWGFHHEGNEKEPRDSWWQECITGKAWGHQLRNWFKSIAKWARESPTFSRLAWIRSCVSRELSSNLKLVLKVDVFKIFLSFSFAWDFYDSFAVSSCLQCFSGLNYLIISNS